MKPRSRRSIRLPLCWLKSLGTKNVLDCSPPVAPHRLSMVQRPKREEFKPIRLNLLQLRKTKLTTLYQLSTLQNRFPERRRASKETMTAVRTKHDLASVRVVRNDDPGFFLTDSSASRREECQGFGADPAEGGCSMTFFPHDKSTLGKFHGPSRFGRCTKANCMASPPAFIMSL